MKRSQMLFLAVAVVLVVGVAVVFVTWPPGDHKNTQGAIGAVEKYRTEQISRSGVVLMDEKTRTEENAVYGDLVAQSLAIAQVRQHLGKVADLAAAQTLDAKQVQAAKESMDAVQRFAASADKELGVQALALISQLESNQALAGFKADMAAVKTDLEAKQYTDAQLGRAASLFAKCEAALAARAAENAAARQFAFAADKLEKAADMVEAVSSLDARQAAGLRENVNAAKEAMTAARADITLNQLQTLNARMMSRQSITAAVSTLQAADRDLAAKGSIYAQAAALGKADLALASDEEALQNLAVLGMAQRLNARVAESATLEAMDRTLNGVTARLAAIQSLEAKADIDAALAAIDKAIAGSQADLAAKYTVASESELAAINSIVESRASINAKASESALGAKESTFAQKADAAGLGSRVYRDKATLGRISSLEGRVVLAEKQVVESRQYAFAAADKLAKSADLAAADKAALGKSADLAAADKAALGKSADLAAADKAALGKSADLAAADKAALGKSADLAAADKAALGKSADLAAADKAALGKSADLAAADKAALGKSADLAAADKAALGKSADLAAAYKAALGKSADLAAADKAALGKSADLAAADKASLGRSADLASRNTLDSRIAEHLYGTRMAVSNKVFLHGADREAFAAKADAMMGQISSLESRVNKF